MRPVFDTNILIDYLNGVPQAARELARYPTGAISPVTWIEVMAGAGAGEDARLGAFLGRFTLVPVDRAIAEAAVALRRQHRLRLPDAIIWATASSRGTLLVTRDAEDFPPDEADIRIPYQL